MNLPDIHTQKLLDCLTHSRLGFALYRLPWTDECYLVLQTSGDVEQLADIQELNGKKGFVMAPFQISEEHPLVLIRPDVTAYDWSEISEALSSLECADALLTCKSRQSELSPFVSEETDKEQYTRAFGRFITPLQEKRFQKLVLSRSSARHIGDDFSPLGAFVRACNNYPRMMIYLCHTPASGTWLGSTPEILLSGHGKEWHTVALAGTMPMQNEVMPTDWDKKNREEQGYVAELHPPDRQKIRQQDDGKRSLYRPCRTIGTPQDRFLFLVEKYRPYRRFIARTPSHSRRLRPAQRGGFPVYSGQ